ncbi:uncharacterized protein TRIADDRAFT_56882 [Trichoplax adhaerens]|uniref:CCDC66 domain-containing protein n=1 Tax=Trichoplax adhaerens TaxID=10228 RepID=B3RWU7_TRIAD|nr:hypothetical protein TRIADDRAFT_56882 [Trichoplax adhaerens]EDV25189.1 hypothetical protein TRIADDRAFT_56882 [Trichoplax adhaerens]|eukprot:XP_002113079.1 hypothetical protein TRIADDRAFT_56882 [Trichoplax adhaerens]
MRSSMIIGEVAPSNWVDQVKEQEKRRWLADLEQQIQSKQQRKKTSKFSSEAQEPSNLLIQNQQQISPVANKEEDENKSYLRGRGFALDSQTQKELEAKRNREMQNQLYNKQQMEEKQRIKQQEQDKLLREENLEIQRLESNTSTVDQAVPDDQQEMLISELKQKRKGNNNVDNTYQKILEAQEAAKLAKKEKLMRKLKKHGHDVSNLYGREGGHAREKPMESRYNKPMVPVLERVEIPEPTNDPAVMQNASDPDDIQLQSPRRKKEGLLLDSSSHAIPVPIEQLAEEEEERLKEEEITPQQSQYDHFRDYGSREDTGEEYTSPQAIARTSNKIRKSVDNDIREKGKGNKSDSRSHDKNEAKGSHNYSKITKSRAVKTQDKVNATARRNGLQNDKNKTHKSIQSKTNKPNGDKRERTERNNKPSIRLINSPKSDPSPTVEYDRDPAEEMYTPEPELKSQRNYVVQNHRGMKELKSRSEIAPIMTTSPIPSNEVLAMRLVNYELEAEVRKLKEQIQDLGRQVMIKRDPTPSPSKPIVSIPTVSNDLPQDEILDQLATLRKGLLLRRNELERAYTPYSAQIMNDSEYT